MGKKMEQDQFNSQFTLFAEIPHAMNDALVIREPASAAILFGVLLVAALIIFPPPTTAATEVSCRVYVSQYGSDNNGTCGEVSRPCASIQQGIINAHSGGIVCVSANGAEPYFCPQEDGFFFNAPMSVVSINGSAIIECQGRGPAFSIGGDSGAASLIGFTLRNASVKSAIWASPPILNVIGCSVEGNSYPRGSAILMEMSVTNALVVNNTFRHNGATSIVISPVLSYGLNLTVAGNVFYRNDGGIEVQYLEAMPVCALAFLNNTFVDNRGTAVTLTIADLPHASVLFRNNITTGTTAPLLGAVLSLQLDGDLDFANNRIAFNDGSVALTIDGKNVTARIVDNVFLSNRASGLQVDSSFSPFNLLLRGNTFANNTAGRNTYYSGGALLWIAGAVKAVFEANVFLGTNKARLPFVLPC